MTHSLCRRLAYGNITKNYRFFIPRILTEVGLTACFYIIFTLACDVRLSSVKGGDYLPTFMWMGAVIIGLLSFILILYTNSFLMKQRKREFGLYSVLGMEKKHICRVLFGESLICCVLSVIFGLSVGILFYKLSSLAICKLLKTQIIAGFYFITPKTVLPAGAIFIGIDLVAYIINCIGIYKMDPVELISSTHTGEKEPKIKWLLFILGILSLGGGYYISLTTESPLKAILLFFAAVLMVIAGTYLLFISGSIFVLKTLKKNDKYYYKPGHFTSVSGLLYRMKQNAVGLASVAILATSVLIMISSTFCLYSGTENVLNNNYPQDLYVPSVFFDDNGNPVTIPEDVIYDIVSKNAARYGLKIDDRFSQEYLEVSYSMQDGELITDIPTVSEETDFKNVCNITYITEKTYTKLGGEPLGLNDNEVAVCSFKSTNGFDYTSFVLSGKSFDVTETLTFFPVNTRLVAVNCFGMVVANDDVLSDIYNAQKDAYGPNASEIQKRCCFVFDNRKKTVDCGDALADDISDSITEYIEASGHTSYSIMGYDAYWDARESVYGMYGTLLFLGILLGIVCLFATVLIIYYKQISEGYEDRNRYQIMQKIGMTDREVKKTVKSQLMTVFFLPLITAGVHVAFAYPIVSKLMEVLLLSDRFLFIKWCAVVYVAFALVYTVIYRMTARTYYKIVN